jgi:hypothetical protein
MPCLTYSGSLPELGLVVLGITTVMLFRFPIVGACSIYGGGLLAISTCSPCGSSPGAMSDPLKLTARLRVHRRQHYNNAAVKALVLSTRRWAVLAGGGPMVGIARVSWNRGQDLLPPSSF